MKKAQIALVTITAAFLCVLLGIFIGRNISAGVTLYSGTGTAASESDAPQNRGKLDLNTATVSQLQMLPGIGEVIAQSIVSYRQDNGPFASIDELINVKGIGAKRLKEIQDYITVGG